MRNLVYLFFFVAFCASAQTKMNLEQENSLRKLVKSRATATKTISSDFTQYKHLNVLNNDVISTGKLNFKNPDLVKWEYLKPNSFSIVFKGEKLFINENGKKKNMNLSGNKRLRQMNKLMVGSIKGDMFDSEEFKVEYFKNNKRSEAHFTPKDKKFARMIQTFVLVFTKTGDVAEVKMIEPSGDYTKLVFSDTVFNSTISDSVFAN